MERTKRTLMNTLWGFVQKIVTILAPFIIRTVLIKVLGAEYLGLNSLLVSILQILNMAELGFSSAIIFSLYKPLADEDTERVCALMALYRKIYRYVGGGILLIGAILTPFLPYIIKEGIPADINLYVIYLMYLVNSALSYLLFAYKSALLDASQHYDIISKTNTGILLLQYVMQIVVLMVFRNYYLFYILTPICTIAYNIALSKIVDTRYPQYKPSGLLEYSALKDLKKRVKGVLIAKFCAVSRNAVSSIVISATLGLVEVAMYTNYFLIVTSLASFLTVITTAMSASVGNSMNTESEEKNHQDFQKFTFIYAWISGLIAVCMIATYQVFMRLWVGEQYMFGDIIPILCSIYFFVLSSGDIRASYMNAKGLWWENRYRTILEALSNVAFSFLMIKIMGISGLLIGQTTALLLFNFLMSSVIMYKYCFPHFNVISYFIQYAKYALVTFFTGALVYFGCTTFSLAFIPYIGKFITFGIFAVVFVNIAFYISYRRDKNFVPAKMFIINMLHR